MDTLTPKKITIPDWRGTLSGLAVGKWHEVKISFKEATSLRQIASRMKRENKGEFKINVIDEKTTKIYRIK